MEGIQGAVLSVKLDFIEEWTAARREHAADYIERLTDLPGLTLPQVYKDRKSVYHLFVVELNNRDSVAKKLNEAGVQTGLHYPVPVHLQPAYRHLGLTEGAFPNSERLAKRCLSLPMFPELTSEQIDQVCEQLAANLFK
jgi:dTDP-4-amino-4,6-dideoxygalactose transaminase